jgi:hypothetical protein
MIPDQRREWAAGFAAFHAARNAALASSKGIGHPAVRGVGARVLIPRS